MKHPRKLSALSLLSLSSLTSAPAWAGTGPGTAPVAAAAPAAITTPASIDLNAGTLGAGMGIGYEIAPGLRLRLRGALLSYQETETWAPGSHSKLNLHGNNLGLLLDYHPGGGHFYLTAGLTLSESNMRYHARLSSTSNSTGNTIIGGTEYSISSGNQASITGKYNWNHTQPYLGIGYRDTLPLCTAAYYALDLGINIMGKGKFSVSSSGNLRCRGAYNQLKPATDAQLETSIRNECRDFFKIADDLHVYPVIQLSIGAQF